MGFLKGIGVNIKNKLIRIFGIWFYPARKLPVGTHLEYFLKYRVEFELQIIVDVGANVGKFSSSLHRIFNYSDFHCIEPFSSTFLLLRRNLTNPKFHLHNFALGDKNECIEVAVNSDYQSDTNSLKNILVQNKGVSTEIINVITLDEFIWNNKLKRIDFLKIDTEGFDLKVLQGGIENLNSGSIKLILVECGLDSSNMYHVFFSEIISFLTNKNYVFIGLFQTDIRKIKRKIHFSNALFVHESMSEKIKTHN